MRAWTTGAHALSWADGLRRVRNLWPMVKTIFVVAICLLLTPIAARAANEVYTYDNAGRLITVEHGDGRTTTYSLDPAGNRTNARTDLPGSPGAISFVAVSGTYLESQGTVTVNLRRAGGAVGTVSATVATSFAGTAPATAADVSVSPTSVTWAANDSADKSVTVTIVDDATFEADETFDLVINTPTGGATVVAPASIPFTITNNDGVPEAIPPSIPTNVTATAQSSSQITLSWTGSTDASGIREYTVRRCSSVNCGNFTVLTPPAPITGTSFIDTGLSEITSYSYQVRAVDNIGNNGSYSGTVSAVTRDATGPTAPSNFNAALVMPGNRVDLTWDASGDNVEVTGYRVERCIGSACNIFSQIATTTPVEHRYNDVSTSQLTTYRYRVYAVDAVPNNGAYSVVLTVSTLDATPPTAPTLQAPNIVSPYQVDLSWSGATDNVAVTGYKIYRDNQAVTTVPVPSYTDDPVLQPQTAYTFQVSALDEAGNESPRSNAVQATTPDVPDTTPPTAPSSLVATAISSVQVNLTWSISTDVGKGLARYEIFRNGTYLNQVPPSPFPQYSDTSTSGLVQYTYTVKAIDLATPPNTSPWSNSAIVTPPDTFAPTAPSGLTATPVNGSTVTLSWTASTDQGGSPYVNYWIYRNGSSTALNSSAVNHPTISYSDTTATAGGTFTYTVRARDSAGNWSDYSNTASATTPTILSASLSTTTWTWRKIGNAAAQVPGNVVVTASGGTGGYTYAWRQVAGDDTSASATAPTNASTGFTRPTPLTNWTWVHFWVCRVTDSSGAWLDTPQVEVGFIRMTLD